MELESSFFVLKILLVPVVVAALGTFFTFYNLLVIDFLAQLSRNFFSSIFFFFFASAI